MSHFKKFLFSLLAISSVSLTAHAMEESIALTGTVSAKAYHNLIHIPMAAGSGGGKPPKYEKFDMSLFEEIHPRPLIDSSLMWKLKSALTPPLTRPCTPTIFCSQFEREEIFHNCLPSVPIEIWKVILAELSPKERSKMALTCLRLAEICGRVDICTVKFDILFKVEVYTFNNFDIPNLFYTVNNFDITNLFFENKGEVMLTLSEDHSKDEASVETIYE